ncbi:SGNH/GDSL hydrolase family protein [Lacibacter sediminis]|uniref:SGNH/GDSL hydrolase family protein n=1 Tax=Lacibacter sediminis TaxID=2760713 RepID=A0A7G5XCH8_9BACT|nr:SGNH/GDSL hydrolase family protein [Lacibacter sediminis]QNA43181.1 SGNH/GDSL hydrolase family protein [Lacibacter sediminis]
MKKKAGYVLFLFISTILLAEIVLRIYNPFHFRVKGNTVQLPVNQKYKISTNASDGLDSVIIHTKNQLGFRGPDMGKDFANRYSIFVVGGSSTECLLLSDGEDWPNILLKKLQPQNPNLWINNAGIDGASSYGHILLLQQHLLRFKPKMIIFMLGINDINRVDINGFDNLVSINKAPLFVRAAEYSELWSTLLNLYRTKKARDKSLTHNSISAIIDGKTAMSDANMKKLNFNLQGGDGSLKATYKKRLLSLIELCRKNEINPVFITQPCITGNAVDSVTGKNMAHIQVTASMKGNEFWELLQAYNRITIETANEEQCFVIDAASSFPKSRQMYYDLMHFRKEGAQAFADTVYTSLAPYLSLVQQQK